MQGPTPWHEAGREVRDMQGDRLDYDSLWDTILSMEEECFYGQINQRKAHLPNFAMRQNLNLPSLIIN